MSPVPNSTLHNDTSTESHSAANPVPLISEMPSKFTRTIREIVHDDYYPDMIYLKKRLDKLERHLKAEAEHKRPEQPIIQYMPLDDDDKLNELMRQMHAMNEEMEERMMDFEEALNGFINSLGVSQPIFHPFIISSLSHHT